MQQTYITKHFKNKTSENLIAQNEIVINTEVRQAYIIKRNNEVNLEAINKYARYENEAKIDENKVELISSRKIINP